AQEGIRCRAVDSVPSASRPVVADSVQLVRASSHPGDRSAWSSVSRAPFCGSTSESLQRSFGADHVTPVPVSSERSLRPAPVKAVAAPLATAPAARQGSLFDDTENPAQGALFDDAASEASRVDPVLTPVAAGEGEPSFGGADAPRSAEASSRPDEYARSRQVAAILSDTRNASGAMPFA
ncbi:hypothetical protein OY671_010287, partial [Metschnikowia pulcherrima]